jgi:uridine kinase
MVMHPTRRAVITEVADAVAEMPASEVRTIGIDGVDGAGKTVFADELAGALRARGLQVIRASVDGFHNPPHVRYRLGRHSPVGYFQDSYDYDQLRELLLDPLSSGGARSYVTAIYDVKEETPVDIEVRVAPLGSVLVFDGIFLHRPELADYWDCSVFLRVEREVARDRTFQRDGSPRDPDAREDSRYVEGQKIYLETCRPESVASIVVDNNVLDQPRILTCTQSELPTTCSLTSTEQVRSLTARPVTVLSEGPSSPCRSSPRARRRT